MMSIALPLTALLAFSGYTVSVMLQAEQSLIDFGISLMSRPDTAQVVIDLYLLATLAGHVDGQGCPVAWAVDLVGGALFVVDGGFCIGWPLLYLVVRGVRERRKAVAKCSQML